MKHAAINSNIDLKRFLLFHFYSFEVRWCAYRAERRLEWPPWTLRRAAGAAAGMAGWVVGCDGRDGGPWRAHAWPSVAHGPVSRCSGSSGRRALTTSAYASPSHRQQHHSSFCHFFLTISETNIHITTKANTYSLSFFIKDIIIRNLHLLFFVKQYNIKSSNKIF